MRIVVRGMPGPQGSKRYMGTDGHGHGIMVESSALVKPWREAVKWAAIEAKLSRVGIFPIWGPVQVTMVFSLPRPKSAPKTRLWPDRKPDISKLVRSTEDALTDAGIWEDDARVVHCIASKVFVGSPGALEVPGCVIDVGPMAACSLENVVDALEGK